ncbi:MAG: PAS domain S-box protein, partial [Pseudomonas sp.]
MPLVRLRHAQWRSVLWFGALVALLLVLGLSWVLVNDRNTRIAFAQRQAVGAAAGIERLLQLELRNLERVMLAIADDGAAGLRQGSAQALLGQALRSAVARQTELESIVVLDSQGRALTPGRGDPQIAQWAVPQARGDGHALFVGPLERLPDGSRGLRLALRMAPDHWLLARLRTGVLQAMVSTPELGHDSVLSVLRLDGTLIARNPDPGMIGTRLPLALRGDDHALSEGIAFGARRSQIDGHRRIGAGSQLRDYPLLVFAAIAEKEVLRPWWAFLVAAIALLAAYCLGLAYLLRSLRRAERRQAQLLSELRASDEQLRRAHQAGGIGTWWIGEDGQWLQLSPQTLEMFGLSQPRMTVAELIGQVHADDRSRLKWILARGWYRRHAFDATCRLLLRGLGERWIAVHGAMLEGGSERQMTGTVVDVSERVEIQALAMQAQRQFRLIFEINPLPCWLFDLDTLRFLEVNPAAIRQYGYSREQFLSMRITDIRVAGDVADITRLVRAPVAAETERALLTVHRLSDGRLIDVRVHASRLEIAGIQAWLVLAENVSDYVAYQRELAHRASHDAATGLLNVAALAERLRDAGTPRYSIAHVQLRGLQLIGDTLGRGVGGQVLRSLCERL